MKKFLILSVLVPVVLFAIMETALRIAGYESPLMDPYASFVEHRPLFIPVDDEFQTDPARAAVFHFMVGKCLDRLGRKDEAGTAYELARDYDGFPHRALSSFNNTVRRVAAGEGPLLFDGEKLFVDNSPDGIPGKNLFLDQCHPNEEGHKLLAKGLLNTVTAAGLVK